MAAYCLDRAPPRGNFHGCLVVARAVCVGVGVFVGGWVGGWVGGLMLFPESAGIAHHARSDPTGGWGCGWPCSVSSTERGSCERAVSRS